ncbi:MAG: gluconeogenesis factor YvcK family protein [Desulfobacterales bacterium]
MDIKHIVTIGGGTGQYVLLSALKRIEGIEISAVVSMVDSGGSTGRLRDELGILPPGDVLKCILALSPHQEMARTIFLKRFRKDRRLEGHNAGNMLLTMLSRFTGSFPTGIQALAEILDVRGTILPVTIDPATLVAELTDGSRIYGEHAIDVPRGTQREKIRDVYLVPHHSDTISVYPPVTEAIARADTILIGPGDLFTSIVPNLIVPGMAQALAAAPGPIFYLLNIMTKFGETHQFKGRTFVTQLEAKLKRPVDGVIYNTRQPPDDMLAAYGRQKSDMVQIDPQNPGWAGRQLVGRDLLDASGNILRHHPVKLAVLLGHLLERPLKNAAQQAAPQPMQPSLSG